MINNVKEYSNVIANRLKNQSDALVELVDELYDKYFAHYFERMRKIYELVSKDCTKLTDEDLEYTLTDLPLELFSVSEELSKFRLHNEVVKLNIKKCKKDASDKDKSDIEKESSEVEGEYTKLVQSVYEAVISRVESEISFSKEFIMVLKKFWDSRRATENVVPVGEVAPEIPDYEMPKQ